ncbi:hypothetical protein TorRG33x02_138550, partial [Trema orientale]
LLTKVPSPQNSANLIRNKGINTGILDLSRAKVRLIPMTPSDRFGLHEIRPKNLKAQIFKPNIPRNPTPIPSPSQSPKIDEIGDVEAIIVVELLGVSFDPDSDEGVVVIAQKVDQRIGDSAGVEELEDEARSAHAELQDRDWVGGIGPGVGPPLDIEANDEPVESPAVDVLDVLDPGLDHGCLVGD